MCAHAPCGYQSETCVVWHSLLWSSGAGIFKKNNNNNINTQNGCCLQKMPSKNKTKNKT